MFVSNYLFEYLFSVLWGIYLAVDSWIILFRGSTLIETTHPGQITISMSWFMTGGPGKEHGTNKPPPTRRVRERSKGDTTCPPTPQNPSLWHPSWLNKMCTTRKDSELEWLAKDNPETNPITIKPKTASHWQGSPPGFPYLLRSTRVPFPIKSLALSAHVSPWTTDFWVLDKSPVSGPGRGPPFCNKWATLAGLFSLRLTSWPLGVLKGQLACQWTRPSGCTGTLCPRSPPEMNNWPECPYR